MVSVTATGKADRARSASSESGMAETPRRRISGLSWQIIFFNAVALAIMIAGVLLVQSGREGLVDERNLGRSFGITGVEITSGQQRNLQCFEIAGADPGEPRPVVHGAGVDAEREHASTDQDVGGSGGSLDLRDGADCHQAALA